jgi:alpha-ketoglutarate-dependent taurine dioxygenase
MKLKETPLMKDFATLVELSHGKAEVRLSPELREQLIQLVKRRGVVLFRGFNLDVDEFESFRDQFGTIGGFQPKSSRAFSRFLGPPVKWIALGAHSELAYTPWPPDLIWLYCVQPSASRGRTTVYDGIRFLKELDSDTRDLFFSKKLLFSQSFGREKWRAFFGKTQREARATLEPHGIAVEFKNSELIAKYVVSAIKKTRYGGHEAFVNSIDLALDYPEYGMTFEDGKPLPSKVKRSVRATAKRIALPLAWQTGDFAVVDNSRVMHGREAYKDPARDVQSRYATAQFL